MFTGKDLNQFHEKGITAETVHQQLDFFNSGFPFPQIVSPATTERGISAFGNNQIDKLIEEFDSYNGEVSKFVPASGAATRMFKDLYELSNNEKASVFFDNLSKFAFYDDLKGLPGFDSGNKEFVLRKLLYNEGLNYGALPKGLLKFHRYANGSRTPFEEHLLEAFEYAKGKDGIVRMTMSVSPEHLAAFKELCNRIKNEYEKRTGTVADIRFTLQKQSTDTVAVTANNEPFRKPDGTILFRPGGHGALIENLNDITSSIVFIKNIDNVAKESMLPETVKWKKILGGALISIQKRIFGYLTQLDGELNTDLLEEIEKFLDDVLCIKIPSVPQELLKVFLREKLNRPIRVCGMVKNTGEPGGGPFIVKDADGSTSLQILEKAQLNEQDSSFNDLMEMSTHFNPVDLACSLIDYNGNKFDLHKYIDPETGFISVKSIEGTPVKAQELPGLWNGAMSQWNTMFVEVPVSTFNPVKTVFDLLREEHQ